MCGLQMEPVISKGLAHEFANTKAKDSSTSYWDRMLQSFMEKFWDLCKKLQEKFLKVFKGMFMEI